MRIEPADLDRIGLFHGLTPAELSSASAAFTPFVIGAGEDLLCEGESDRSLLLVVAGEVQIALGEVEVARVGPGEVVGEMALFGTLDRRSASVRSTVGPTKLLVLDDDALRFLRAQGNPVVRTLEVFALRGLYRRIDEMQARIGILADPEPLPAPTLMGRIAGIFGSSAGPTPLDVLGILSGFASRDPAVLQALAARMTVVGVARGHTVVAAGQPVPGAFLLAAGAIGVWPPEALGPVQLAPGQLFGRIGPASPALSEVTCVALEPCWLLHVPAAAFDALESGLSPEAAVFRRGVIDAMAAQLRWLNDRFLATLARD